MGYGAGIQPGYGAGRGVGFGAGAQGRFGAGPASGFGAGYEASSWSPLSLGSSLAAQYDAALDVSLNSAAYFYGPNTQYFSRASFMSSPVTAFTVCGWTTDLVDAAYPGMFCVTGAGGHVFSIQQQLISGCLFAYFGAGLANLTITDASAGLTSGRHHVALVYDGGLAAGSRAKWYIDGSLVASTVSSGTIPASISSTTPDLLIGYDGTYALTGYMQKWSYFTTALDAAAIASLYNSGVPIPYASLTAGQKVGMASHYELATSAGVSLVDSHGGLTLTDHASVGYGLSFKSWGDQSAGNRDASADYGFSHDPVVDSSAINSLPALIFDGSAAHLDVADDAGLSPSTGLSIYLVGIIGTLPASEVALLSKRNDQVSQSWALTLDKPSGKLRFHVAIDATSTAYGEATIPPDNSVRMIVVVYDGTLTGNANRLKVYIGGVQETLTFSGTIPATLVDSSASLIIGAQKSSGTLALYAPFRAAEIGVVSEAITPGTTANLHAWLVSKYGSLVVA